MQVSNVPYALAEIQDAKKSPSAHHRTTLSGYVFATKARIDNRKKSLSNSNISPQVLTIRELRPTSSWDRFGCLEHPSKFQRVSRLGFVTASTSLNRSQPNFARWLTVSYAATLYIQGLLSHNAILPGAKFTLPPSLALFYMGSVTAPHSSSGRQKTLRRWAEAPPIFGRAASRWPPAHILVFVYFSMYSLRLPVIIKVFSERELMFTFAILLSPVRLSSVVCLSHTLSVICLSSVTFVRPTQAVQIFWNISTALGTLAIHWHPLKISRRSSQTSPPGELNTRGVAKYSDFWTIDGSETVQDRR